MTEDLDSLPQTWPAPSKPRPIVIIGAGGIVNSAHIPAWRKAEFPIAGIFDLDAARTRDTAERWGIHPFAALSEATQQTGVIFDLATPPGAHRDVLAVLPEDSAVLIQKPMGSDLADATSILQICRQRQLTAAVNFQLRFAPMVLALRAAIANGMLGHIVDLEVHLNLLTPWHLFPFLKGLDRVEIAVHSVHYLDLIRALLGNPAGVYARTLGHPSTDLAQTRTSAILDFASDVRCVLSINHNHAFGRRFQDATIRVEGDTGAALIKLGLLLDYPRGEPDELWLFTGGDWRQVQLSGSWFPDAFVARMANLQRFVAGEDAVLDSTVEDAWDTMALVEACFRSARAPSTPVPQLP